MQEWFEIQAMLHEQTELVQEVLHAKGLQMTQAEFNVINEERIRLINKNHSGRGLDPEEHARLDHLQELTREYVDTVAPIDMAFTDKLQKLIAETMSEDEINRIFED